MTYGIIDFDDFAFLAIGFHTILQGDSHCAL